MSPTASTDAANGRLRSSAGVGNAQLGQSFTPSLCQCSNLWHVFSDSVIALWTSLFFRRRLYHYTKTMYEFQSLAWSFTCLLLLQARASNIAASTIATTASLQESSTASPICLQSLPPTNSVAAAIQSSVTNDLSINKACDPSTQQNRVIPWNHVFYSIDKHLYFNISLQDLSSIGSPSSMPTSYPGNRDCILAFNAIFFSCVISRKSWGGWVESKGLNYSSKCAKNRCLQVTDFALISRLHSSRHGLCITRYLVLMDRNEL